MNKGRARARRAACSGILTRARLNGWALERMSAYLNFHSRFITSADVKELTSACAVTEEEAVALLLSAACGLDGERSHVERALEEEYFHQCVRRLDDAAYRRDPYYRNIHFPQAQMGRWQLTRQEFEAYELFVRDDLLCLPDGREIPQLGFFADRLSYPAVLEDGREWMTVTPNEIATMTPAIERSHGHVVTMGLGLGYFAFRVSEKENVRSVTVVERDADVIALFARHILPQFSHRQKIRIINADAFEWIRNMPEETDYVFVDLWHDVADGVALYMRMKRLEACAPRARFDYWIETSLLSWMRTAILNAWCDGETAFDDLIGSREDEAGMREALGDESLRRWAALLPVDKLCGSELEKQ